MTKFILLAGSLALFQISTQAQTTHDVSVENFSFTPALLEIATGDVVRWTNIGGQHSVDANAINFPDNPEPFGNGIGPAGWMYEFTFTLPGAYSYRCGVHTGSMFGSVVVSGDPVSVNDKAENDVLTFFPNPASTQLNWKWRSTESTVGTELRLSNILGQEVFQVPLRAGIPVNVANQPSGIYFYQVFQGNEIIQSGRIIIKQN